MSPSFCKLLFLVAVSDFEQNYAKYILWQKNKGMTTAEMAQVVQNWADKKSIGAQAAGR